MNAPERYPIGTPGTPWGENEKCAWFDAQSVKRSYADEVVAKIDALRSEYDVAAHGELPVDPARYPLFVLKSRNWSME